MDNKVNTSSGSMTPRQAQDPQGDPKDKPGASKDPHGTIQRYMLNNSQKGKARNAVEPLTKEL